MSLTLIAGLAMLGLSAVLVVRAVALPRLRAVARVNEIAAYGNVAAVPSPAGAQLRKGGVIRLAASVGSAFVSRAGEYDLEDLRRSLHRAGLYRIRPEAFIGCRLLAGAGLGGFALFSGGLAPRPIALAAALGAAGWIGPKFFVSRKATFRAQHIEDALPDLIDLLVVTVEAGLSLSSSLRTASRRTEGPLGEELRLAMQEQRMGLPVADVLQNMLNRGDSPSMRSFVRSLVQGETLGVSIGTIMRNLSNEMRQRRRARAEERANKAPIKMLFPLIFFIFPSIFVVLLGPAVSQISKAFSAM